MFQVVLTLGIGIFGYILLLLDFHPAPILLGFVLGPRFEENFRRAMLISRGDIGVFVEHPISAVFVGLAALLIAIQIVLWLRHSTWNMRISAIRSQRSGIGAAEPGVGSQQSAIRNPALSDS
jgi:putative tricarboxylic transport membrane protein